MTSKKKAERVSVELDRELLRGLAAEMARMRRTKPGKPTRAGAIRAVLHREFRTSVSTKSGREKAYRETLSDVQDLKKEARRLLSEGLPLKAHKTFLSAAIMELYALQLLEDPSEEEMKSTLIEVVGLLKNATGYKHLPDVPGSKREHADSAV